MTKTRGPNGDTEHETLRPVLTVSEIQKLPYEKYVYVGEFIGIIDKPFKRA